MDALILLRPGFLNPAFPGQRFFCWHCALLEGVLASAPDLAARLDVLRIDWPRPRREAIELIGEANQSLPVLILREGATSPRQTGTARGRSFIAEKDAILEELAVRYGFPRPHP